MKYIIICISILVFYCVILKYNNTMLKTENEKLTNENVVLKDTIKAANDKIVKIENANIELSKTVDDFRISTQSLQGKLYKLEKNVTKMSLKHPKMVNDIINNAQKKLNDCFEKISQGEDYESCEE